MLTANKFSMEHREINDVNCLYLRGYLDAHTAPELETAINNLLENNRYKILVNFKDLDYISSAGLGVFMAFIEVIRDNGGDIKLSEMKPKVFSVFDLLGFPILFDVVEEDTNALSKFSNNEMKANV